MARISKNETIEIYKAAENFKEKCLKNNGSLLFEGMSIWHRDVLNRLKEAVTKKPAGDDKNFFEIIKKQINPNDKEAIHLAAEALCVYFLFPKASKAK